MSACEKCWADAGLRILNHPLVSQSEHYQDLLEERKFSPCSPREQAGQWWDEEKQYDSRELEIQ